MKKGFTLIELLAVIVILAIIALITTPIVLNLINQSKEAANKRSVEAYAKAVEYAVIQYEYNNNGELPTSFDDIKDNVEYSNSDVKCLVQINDDKKGSIDICNCQVGDYTNAYYKYSSKVGNKGATIDEDNNESRTQSSTGICNRSIEYYCPGCVYTYSTTMLHFNGTISGSQYKTDYKDVIAESGKNIFLGLILDENRITRAFVCAVKDNLPFCIEGSLYDNYGGDAETRIARHNKNKEILNSSALYDNSCTDNPNYLFSCSGSINADSYWAGDVDVNDSSNYCYVLDNGGIYCY